MDISDNIAKINDKTIHAEFFDAELSVLAVDRRNNVQKTRVD